MTASSMKRRLATTSNHNASFGSSVMTWADLLWNVVTACGIVCTTRGALNTLLVENSNFVMKASGVLDEHLIEPNGDEI